MSGELEEDDFTAEGLKELVSDSADSLDAWFAERGVITERARLKAELATERAAREKAERELALSQSDSVMALAVMRDQLDEARHEFKNFHRNLCERFDYCHDEEDWRRDQVSLIEHIAARAEKAERERDALREALEAQNARKKFPILGSGGASIDRQLVADHGKQAQANHYQSVERLAERGGLSWCELYAVLHNRKWQKMDDNEAMIACRALEAKYLAALTPLGEKP